MAKNYDNIVVAVVGSLFALIAILTGSYNPEDIVKVFVVIGVLLITMIGVSTILIIKNLKEIN